MRPSSLIQAFRPAPLALAASALAASAVLSAGCAAHTGAHKLIPIPYPGYEVEEGAAVIRAHGYEVTILPLDDVAREAFIAARAGGGIDPFGPGPDGKARYLTFRLLVENTTAKDLVTFQPQNILLTTDVGDRITPLDYPQAYSRLVGVASSDPRLVSDLSKYLFDVGVSVAAGKSALGLLVYPAPKATGRKLRMEFSFFQVNGESSANSDVFFAGEPGR